MHHMHHVRLCHDITAGDDIKQISSLANKILLFYLLMSQDKTDVVFPATKTTRTSVDIIFINIYWVK